MNTLSKSIFLFVILFITFCYSLPVDARAGGGGSYSGGGGRSSGSGGRSSGGSFSGGGGFSSSGSNYSSGSNQETTIFEEVISVMIFTVVIIAWLIREYNLKPKSIIRKSYRSKFPPKKKRKKPLVKLRQIKMHDSKFNDKLFIKNVNISFLKIQNAWSENKLSDIRTFVSDGIFERFSILENMLQETKLNNIMKDTKIIHSWIVKIESDKFFDTIHVEITASAKDYTFSLEDKKIVMGSKKKAETFTEYWSFLRKRGTTTLEKPGLSQGFCPSCGAQIEILDKTSCQYCKAIVNSGEYDWILSEITQEEEWHNTFNTDSISGLKELQNKDKNFNIQHVEDRVSAIFWRLRAAELFSDASYLSKVCKPDFLKNKNQKFIQNKDGLTTFYADAAKGSVDLAEVNLDQGGVDILSFRVKWSGHKETLKIPSLVKPSIGLSRLIVHEFCLIRNSNVSTSKKNLLNSLNCNSCGAIESKGTDGKCQYCGAALNDGSQDWVLSSICTFSKRSSNTSLKSGIMPEFDYDEMLSAMIKIMYADKVLDKKETTMIQSFARKWRISSGRLQTIINTTLSDDFEYTEIHSQKAQKEFLQTLVQMCLVDGAVSKSEKEILCSFGQKWNFSESDIKYMIVEQRKGLLKVAKQCIKQQRS